MHYLTLALAFFAFLVLTACGSGGGGGGSTPPPPPANPMFIGDVVSTTGIFVGEPDAIFEQESSWWIIHGSATIGDPAILPFTPTSGGWSTPTGLVGTQQQYPATNDVIFSCPTGTIQWHLVPLAASN
jgi:hypothetical protein